MNNGLKLLLMAAGTIITIIVVTIALNMAKESKKIDETYGQRMNEMYKELDESDITMYDGKIVYGSDVVNFIKKKLSTYKSGETSPIKITVITAISPEKKYAYTNNVYISDIQNFTKQRYIKPLNEFLGTVIYNNNDVITEVIFKIN